jgi:exopolysaccharide production protein ExoZ
VQKLRSVQVLRAIAACAVVILHAVPDAHAPVGGAGYGAAGVDLFFVISGFIMANVARGRMASEFLRDRFWRIYPLWWVAVLPWLFMIPRGPTFVASSLTLWPIYAGGYYVPVLKVGWTLSFELLFYLGMALAVTTRAWVPLTLYALLLFGALTTLSPLLHFLGSPMTLEFLMGVVIAKLPRRAALGLLIPLGLALLAMAGPDLGDVDSSLSSHWALPRALEWGIPAALIVCGALSLEGLFQHRLFNMPVMIGDASYSVYLFHPIVAYGLTFVWPLRLALAVGVGCAVHLLIERRIMAARKRWPSLSGRPQSPVAGEFT